MHIYMQRPLHTVALHQNSCLAQIAKSEPKLQTATRGNPRTGLYCYGLAPSTLTEVAHDGAQKGPVLLVTMHLQSGESLAQSSLLLHSAPIPSPSGVSTHKPSPLWWKRRST